MSHQAIKKTLDYIQQKSESATPATAYQHIAQIKSEIALLSEINQTHLNNLIAIKAPTNGEKLQKEAIETLTTINDIFKNELSILVDRLNDDIESIKLINAKSLLMDKANTLDALENNFHQTEQAFLKEAGITLRPNNAASSQPTP